MRCAAGRTCGEACDGRVGTQGAKGEGTRAERRRMAAGIACHSFGVRVVPIASVVRHASACIQESDDTGHGSERGWVRVD